VPVRTQAGPFKMGAEKSTRVRTLKCRSEVQQFEEVPPPGVYPKKNTRTKGEGKRKRTTKRNVDVKRAIQGFPSHRAAFRGERKGGKRESGLGDENRRRVKIPSHTKYRG